MKPHPSRTTDLQSNYDHLLGKRPTTGYSKNYADHASILRRFGALFLDGLVLVCFDVLIELLGLRTIEWKQIWRSGSSGLVIPDSVMLGTIITAFIYMAYFLSFYSTSGQTFGKKLMKIRVVREDGADLDFATGLRRTLAIWLPNQFPLLLALTGGQTTTLKVAILLTIIVAFVFQFFDYCSAFVDPNKQSFHDLIADTIVIDA